MGLFGDMSAMENEIYGDLENDEDLEAELLALQGGGSGSGSGASSKKSSPVKQKAEPPGKCECHAFLGPNPKVGGL